MDSRILFVFGLALAVGSCVESRCYEDSDCPSPKVCGASGSCGYQCSLDADCGDGFECLLHVCKVKSVGPIVCPDDMVAVAQAYCLDRYEASRPDAGPATAGLESGAARSVAGVIPWRVQDNAEAAAACEAAGKRLCTPEEWRLGCKGPDGTEYAYGDNYEATTCNGINAFGEGAFHLAPTGSFPDCTNEWGVLDMNGNVWEHVAGGDATQVRGGAYNCGDSVAYHRCDYIPGNWNPSALGFRCCLTPDTNTPDTNTPDSNTPDTNTPDTSTPDTNTPDTNTDTGGGCLSGVDTL
jgi:hypothetical protein